MIYLLIFMSSCAVTFLLTPFIRSFALRLSLTDKKSNRKIHNKVITRFGGLSIYIGFIFSVLLVFIFRFFDNHDVVPVKLIIFSSTMILFLGIYDDVKGANAKIKFCMQILASVIIIYGGVVINKISNPWGQPINLGLMSIPFTLLWLVGITNAINLIDGLDGLASGIVFIVCLGLFVVFLINENLIAALLIIALAGSCLGFLRYNFFPAKIFMGDTGSLFLGFTVATISALAHHKANTTVMLLVPIIGLGVPILDTSMAFIRRVLNRKNPFKADDSHIHHFLVKKKLTKQQTVFVLWGITAFLNLVACLFYFLSVRNSV